MTAPARVRPATARRPRSSVVRRRGAAQEFGSLLWELAPALGELAARYPEVAGEVIRQQAVDVLCIAQGNRVTMAMVVRLVEARVIALM